MLIRFQKKLNTTEKQISQISSELCGTNHFEYFLKLLRQSRNWAGCFRVLVGRNTTYSRLCIYCLLTMKNSTCINASKCTLEIITQIICRCVMSLIRGFGGHHPCPVCLVPSDGLTHVHISYPRRAAQTAQNIVWNKHLNAGQKDVLLKEKGLRNIEVL